MRLLCLPVFFMWMHSLQAQQTMGLRTNADDNSLLWEVSGNGLTSPNYLFGTFHMLCKDDLHFSNALKQSMGNVSVVYMEMDMDDPAIFSGGLIMMAMKNGLQLKDLLTDSEFRKVEIFFKDSLHSSLAFFSGMKPLMLTSLVYPKLLPCAGVTSVEDQLLKLAKENKKEVRGLETMAFQASVLDSIPYKDQARELYKTIDSLSKSKLLFNSMTQAYKEQNLAELERMLNDEDLGMEKNQDVLLQKRNRNWVDQLKTIMKTEPVFVAVGAGHLPGKDGLIAQLRQQGYKLRPLENK